MRLVWKQDGELDGVTLPADAPEKPESALILWAGILAAASGSVYFNVFHDTHSLPDQVAGVIAGVLPPFMAATVIHAAKVTGETWVRICVFAVTIAAMVVSAIGTAAVLNPAYHSLGSYLFSVVLDSADLLLLYAIMEHYEKVREYRKWVKAWAASRAGTSPVAPAAGVAAVPVPAGAGTSFPVPAPAGTSQPVPALAPPGTAAGTSPLAPAAPASRHQLPGTGTRGAAPAPGDHPVPEPAPAGASGAGTKQDGEENQGGRPPASAFRGRQADPELCERVVREFAARHPRPAVQDVEKLQALCREFLTEFRARTGERANNREVGLALGIHPKRQVPKVRAAVTEPEGEPAAGEEEATA